MILNFGKYKGKNLEDILEIDPSYIAWASSVGAIEIDKKILRKAQESYYDKRCYEEALFESEHGDWGDRD